MTTDHMSDQELEDIALTELASDFDSWKQDYADMLDELGFSWADPHIGDAVRRTAKDEFLGLPDPGADDL